MSFAARLAYGIAALPINALLLAAGFFPYLYRLGLGMDFVLAGTLVLATRLFDVVTDPLIGYASDRIGFRFGRHKTLIALGLPFMLVGVAIVFFADEDISLTVLIAATLMLYIGWTMAILPLNAWSAELSQDYHERSRLSAMREGLSLAGMLLALWLLLPAAEGDGATIRAAYREIGIFLLVALPLFVVIPLRFLPDYPATPGTGPRGGSFRAFLSNRAFLRLAAAFLGNGIANGLPPVLFLYYVGAVLDRPDLAGGFILLYFLAGILGIPVWNMVGRRLGKAATWRLSMTISAIAFLPAVLLGPDMTAAYSIVVIITGLCLGADFFLPPAIAADTVDQDEILSGSRRSGLYFAVLSMIFKLSWAIAGAAALFLLGWSGFDEALGAGNDPAALLALAGGYALIPAIFKFGAVLMMRRFPLNEAEQLQLRDKLAARRSKAD